MNYFFRKVLKPYIISNRYKNICEIGASEGDNTEKLLKIKGLCITIIDPCIDKDLVAHYRSKDCVKIMKGNSLTMLPRIHAPFDCMLIDGDHNWYTVFNELTAIHKRGLLKKGGTIFLHDMLWPCARRDQYYVPETIPAEFRHPHAKKGVGRHETGLLDKGGANPHIYNACFEGGPRNGVLTAVEDFLKEFWK